MIIGDCFYGDNSRRVKLIQHDMYGEMLGVLYSLASSKYLASERTLDTKTALGEQLRLVDGIDHRTLQYTHDAIAASFRFENAYELRPELPGVSEHPGEETRIRAIWRRYFREEVERILEDSSEFLRNVLRATLFPNPDERGKPAEEALYRYVHERYESMYAHQANKEEVEEYQ